MNIQFQYKTFSWIFLALIALVLLFLFFSAWKNKVKERIGDRKLVDLLISNYSPNKFRLKFILLLAAFALGVLTLMNPRSPGAGGSIQRKGIDIAIALDVSKSMLATDLPPNRLERARQFISKLMSGMPDDRIALVLFAGKAYMQMPLTVDHGAAQLFVSSASPDAVPQQGTVISDALEMSGRVFNAAEKRFKTIILISDGEDHEESASRTAASLASQGVMINTIGIGSPEGSMIPDPLTGENKKDASGNLVITKLNEGSLQDIAKKTNGIYIRLQSSDAAVAAVKSQLSQIERKAFGDVSLMDFTTYYPWLAGLMLLLLLMEILVPENKRAVGRQNRESA